MKIFLLTIDCRAYLSRILSLDVLILNTDRHFNNLGFILNDKTNTIREAPIFDNGSSLLSDWNRFSNFDSIQENIEKVYGQPFSSNLGMQAAAMGIGLKIDYTKLQKLLSEEPESRALHVLQYQLKRYRHIFEICPAAKTSLEEIKHIVNSKREVQEPNQKHNPGNQI